jgi:hypothetical protein
LADDAGAPAGTLSSLQRNAIVVDFPGCTFTQPVARLNSASRVAKTNGGLSGQSG